MFNVLFQLLFFGDPPQPGIGTTNTINSFAEPRNANGASVNTTTPPEPMVNSINSWAEVRNAEVRVCSADALANPSPPPASRAPHMLPQGLPVNSNATMNG
jgi:hypothetical protein